MTILTETIRWTGDGSQPLLLEVSGTHFNVQIEFSQVMSAALPEGLVRETPTRSPAESAREPVGLSQLVGITAGQTSSGTQHTPPPDAPAILPVPVFSGASSSITPSLLDAAPLGSDRLLGGSGGRIAPHEVVPDSDDPWPQRRRPDRPPVAGGKDDDESSDDRALVPDTSDDQHDADSADKADADAADRAFEEELWWFWLK